MPVRGWDQRMNETLLTIFVAVTAVAVVLQMAILLALYFSTRKTTQRMEALAARVEAEALPALESARTLLAENTPKINNIVSNLSEASATVRVQAERIAATLDDVVDRTRLQVIRADEMVSHTFDRIEQTAENMQQVVISPMRRLSAVLAGIVAGVGEFAGGRKVRRAEGAVPREEMFI